MISYRIVAWLFTIGWTYLFTGSVGQATGFATVLHLLLSVDYYIHERIWLTIKWGIRTPSSCHDRPGTRTVGVAALTDQQPHAEPTRYDLVDYVAHEGQVS